MARGGSKRTYTRDANGRFASTPGGGSKSLAAARKAARPTSGRKGTLQARTSLKKSRAKLAAKDPADQRLSTALSNRAQKGAVTKGNKGLKAAKQAAQTKISSEMKGVIRKNKKLNVKSGKPQAQAEQSKGVATSSAKRSKPVDTLTFQGGGIKGPTGATLKAYTWQWRWGSRLNREGDEVSKRVSNWDAATKSDSSGKNVVHQFVVEKNGNRSIVSAEGALKELGFMGDSAKRFGSLKSSLKTYARLRMQRSELEQQQSVADKIYNAKKVPRVKATKRVGPGGAFDGWNVSIGSTKIALRGGAWKPDQSVNTFKDLALREYRQNAIRKATGRTLDAIQIDLRNVNSRIKQVEKKINAQSKS